MNRSRRGSRFADNSSALSWDAPPAATQSFVLIVDDADAPVGTWVHWVLFDLPANLRALPKISRRVMRLSPSWANTDVPEEEDFPTRIYADGMSNGGGMAFALSCKLSDRIAAVGAVAAALSLNWEWCGNSRPVPTMAFHGTADPMALYQGGPSPVSPDQFPNIRDWTDRVARRNRCKGDPSDARITANVRRLEYTNCAENADVMLYTVEGGGHTWPGGRHLPESMVVPTTREISATRVTWEFFLQHPHGSK
jgi:hypothetical protein